MMQSRPCDALPPVRGSYTNGAPLKDLVWFRAGGVAEVLFRPADADDLASFLRNNPALGGLLVRVDEPGSAGRQSAIVASADPVAPLDDHLSAALA